jgi:hypothetical protein
MDDNIHRIVPQALEMPVTKILERLLEHIDIRNHIIKRFLSELPEKRDWLDPDLEKLAKAVVAESTPPLPLPVAPPPGLAFEMPITVGDRKASYKFVPTQQQQRRAMLNHDQTLETLKERGGMSLSEMAAIVRSARWERMEDARAISYLDYYGQLVLR